MTVHHLPVGDHDPANDRSATAPVDPARLDIKSKQELYHDWEAASYEEKFSISYDQRCIDYARDRFRKVVPEGAGFGSVLEVGAGTGFFLINLALGECLDGARLHATDISSKMLEVCRRNGEEHGLDIETRQGDAESLPYDDDSVDLVIGHAFIHHLPVPGTAIAEMYRVLKPGGTLVLAGEPTELGDKLSWMVKRTTYRAFRAVTAVPGLTRIRKPSIRESGGSEADEVLAGLEHEVDLHTFRPADVEKTARLVGFREVEVVTEELTANWFGWAVRTIEGSTAPGVLGARWAYGAFHGYLTLQRFDDEVLSRVVPREVFYNLILHARKPYRS
ncbi:MAG: class I SAM-dependent methyltransferase [Nitriliruptoraceae bacterium]|nr:class I SAM-dependent methyltransferase [Nitriliruptoraceae bacterium]